ncbi:MAG TPA: hypothetical protein VJ438_01540 [Candidatus Nanoarchaeia archaeon]|nr:hypothetical protein [Candidatus Nanoarchaeia archaeon]
MGFGRDLLILIGVLPISMPNFNRYKRYEKTKEQQLKELNGKKIVVRDYYEGVISGKLEYLPCIANFDIYTVHTENNSYRLHIHDLKRIF